VSPPRRGATAVEAALTLPILFVLLAGIFELTWYIHRRSMVAEATQYGARAASVSYDSTALGATATTAVEARLQSLGFAGVHATVTSGLVTTGTVDAVEVSVVVPYTGLTGLMPAPTTIECRASAAYEDPGG